MQAVILAAGKGTRFRSARAKVLYTVVGKTLVRHVVDLADAVGITRKIVVIGYQGEEVKKVLQGIPGLIFVWQGEQLGTGHAVMMAREKLRRQPGEVLILYGDVPGLRPETVAQLIKEHQAKKNMVTILTALVQDPKWYGRIIRNAQGEVQGIQEAKEATAAELQIREINSGIYVVDGSFLLSALKQIRANNHQQEYYLTDIVAIARREGKKIGTFMTRDEDEIKGVNSMEELEEMGEILRRRKGKGQDQ